jgi:hypothetical protein
MPTSRSWSLGPNPRSFARSAGRRRPRNSCRASAWASPRARLRRAPQAAQAAAAARPRPARDAINAWLSRGSVSALTYARHGRQLTGRKSPVVNRCCYKYEPIRKGERATRPSESEGNLAANIRTRACPERSQRKQKPHTTFNSRASQKQRKDIPPGPINPKSGGRRIAYPRSTFSTPFLRLIGHRHGRRDNGLTRGADHGVHARGDLRHSLTHRRPAH